VNLRQILRSLGASEVWRVKMGLQIAKDLALNNTAKVCLSALRSAAKIMGMTRKEHTGFKGADIWIGAEVELQGVHAYNLLAGERIDFWKEVL
jgi:predicted nucleic acid-binding protein